jgi:hypothetical protein
MEAKDRKPQIVATKFWTEYEDDHENPGEKKPVDWVTWVKVGTANPAATSEKISRLHGPRGDSIEWAALSGAYALWKAGEEPVTDGTALAIWPGGSQGLIDALKRVRVYTCEAFCEMPDNEVGKLQFPNARASRDTCRKFMQMKESTASVEAENKTLRGQVEMMMAEIAELKALHSKEAARIKDAKTLKSVA